MIAIASTTAIACNKTVESKLLKSIEHVILKAKKMHKMKK